jgi:hypothetical protein
MLIPLYASALFTSAFLLFWIQPLFTKGVLPLLGGSPAVWNTAMMFFQLMLLAGYGYAYLVSRVAKPGRQWWIHILVVALGFAFLPPAIAQGWAPPSGHSPVFWLVGLLSVSIGWPFFALSASAPLLQSWFGRSGDRLGDDPYFLYVASNAGSLCALLAFPLLLEPALTLAQQSRAWMITYVALAILIGACATPLRRAAIAPAAAADPSPRGPIGWHPRMAWIALAFVPSSLLLGVTSYITTDIASAPLLWVIPLALYLLSFIVAFSRWRLLDRTALLKAEAVAIVLVSILVLVALTFKLGASVAVAGGIHLVTFFLIALVCHTELARRRPDAAGVTEFYFCLSIGGAAGGVFNALVAPVIFSSAYEYYLALAAACAARTFVGSGNPAGKSRDFVLPALLAVFVAALTYHWIDGARPEFGTRLLFLMITAAGLYSFREYPVRFALGVAGVIGTAVVVQGSVGVLHQERSFFGVNRVKLQDQGRKTVLIHGTTTHGAEFVGADRREPLMYFARSGPVGQALDSLGPLRRVGVIGLGTGALACYSKPGEQWTFYEIDGAIERIARDDGYFHFLADCGAGARIVLGDGRLSIAKEPDNYYDLIVVDAFSSDSIPMHLLTKEALSLYIRKLTDHGVILLHISNMYLQLEPVVATLVGSVGASGRDELYEPTPVESAAGASASEWVAIARTARDLSFLDHEPRWKPLAASPGSRPWTDDFSNIAAVIKW